MGRVVWACVCCRHRYEFGPSDHLMRVNPGGRRVPPGRSIVASSIRRIVSYKPRASPPPHVPAGGPAHITAVGEDSPTASPTASLEFRPLPSTVILAYWTQSVCPLTSSINEGNRVHWHLGGLMMALSWLGSSAAPGSRMPSSRPGALTRFGTLGLVVFPGP